MIYILLLKTIKSDMKTAQKIIKNVCNKTFFTLKVNLLKQYRWYLRITNLCQNTHVM